MKRPANTVRAHKLGGMQWLYFFPNGYGASVIQTPHSYGGDQGLYELGVVTGDADDNYELAYETPITDDVIGHLTAHDVDDVLNKIEALPRLEANRHTPGLWRWKDHSVTVATTPSEYRSRNEHTPGPWIYKEVDRLDAYVIWNTTHKHSIASIRYQPGDGAAEAANARLIAEAPAMYKLLSAVTTWKERDDGLVYSDEPMTKDLLEAHAILARIDGESA